MLNLDNLKGIFVAVPIAVTSDGEFIEEDYRADIRAICSSGVHGIYTTGTTGEWYALDDEEFQWMVDVFLDVESEFQQVAQRCADTADAAGSEPAPGTDGGEDASDKMRTGGNGTAGSRSPSEPNDVQSLAVT